MEDINIDILETILQYLPYYDIFSINILCNNMHNMFKCIEFNSRQINVKNINIFRKYSFKNICIKYQEIIDYLTIENMKQLKLDKMRTLNLTNTLVTDVSALGKVHTLDLSRTQVINVSALGNVHTLNLRETGVTDVSALGNVHTLNLYNTYVNGTCALKMLK